MRKGRERFHISQRDGVQGPSWTVRIWDTKKKKYSLTKTFAARDYGEGHTKKAQKIASDMAAAYGEEMAAKMRAGVVAGNIAGRHCSTADCLALYIEHLESSGSNGTYVANIRKRLAGLSGVLPYLDMAGADRLAYEWWQSWCNEPCEVGYVTKGERHPLRLRDNGRKPKSVGTRNNGLRNLKSFVNWCWDYRSVTGLIERVDLSWIKKLREEHTIKPQFNLWELQTGLCLVDHPYVIRWALYCYLGLRTREAIHLRYDDFIEGYVIIRVAKGKKQRVVTMQAELWPFVELHRSAGHDYAGYLFPDNLRRSQSLPKHFDRFLRDAGIDKGGRSTHSLRHCYAGLMTATGEPTAMVQSYLGHSDGDMTMHYAQMAAFYRSAVNGWPRGVLELMTGATSDL